MNRVEEAVAKKLREKMDDHRRTQTVLRNEVLIVPEADEGRFRIRFVVDNMLTIRIAITDVLDGIVRWDIETDDEERAIARYIEIISNPSDWFRKTVRETLIMRLKRYAEAGREGCLTALMDAVHYRGVLVDTTTGVRMPVREMGGANGVKDFTLEPGHTYLFEYGHSQDRPWAYTIKLED